MNRPSSLNLRNIFVLDAPAGAGKTFSIINECAQIVGRGEWIMLVQPTKELIDQTSRGLRERFPHIFCRVIYGDVGSSAVQKIAAYFKEPHPAPHVLIITSEALKRLHFIPGKAAWNLIIDEIPQAFDCFDELLFRSHGQITSHVTTYTLENSRYSILAPTNGGVVRAIAENKTRDKVLACFQPLASNLISPHWHCFVDTEPYQCLLASDKNSLRLNVFSLMNASMFDGFKSVMIAGACFRDSLLYHSFSRQGVRFIEASNARESLRFTGHQNGNNLTIICATQQRWSKRFRDKNDREALKEIVKAVKNEFGEERFIWSANRDIKDDNLFGKERRDDRLSNAPYGLNCWREVDNVAFLSAHNLTPAHGKFLQEQLDLTAEQITTAIHVQAAYQAIMRCSLRDPQNTNHRRVFVPDQATARWLQAQFPGSALRCLDIGLDRDFTPRGRVKLHTSGATRVAAHRDRRAALKQQMVKVLAEFTKTNGSCNENTIRSSNTVTNPPYGLSQFRASIFVRKDAKYPLGLAFDTLDGFEQTLKETHERAIVSKANNHLICPAFFDASKSRITARGNENVVFATGVWLDFDGGDLRPDDFARLFPTLRMTIFNSFSSSKERLRFRVYIRTTTIMSADVYREITHHMLAKIIEAGYPLAKPIPGDPRKAHGVDTGKMGAASLFYEPCQPKDPGGRYFEIFKDKERLPLDPDEWIDKLDVPEFEPVAEFSISPTGTVDERRVENALQQWHTEGCSPGCGNAEFFKLANRLANAGLAEFELGQILAE